MPPSEIFKQRIPVTYVLAIVMSCFGAAVSYGYYRSSVDENTQKMVTMEGKQTELQTALQGIQVEMARVRQSLDDLKASVDEIKKH